MLDPSGYLNFKDDFLKVLLILFLYFIALIGNFV